MRRSLALATALGVASAGSCKPNATAPLQRLDPSQLFWAVTLDHHAVTLSTVAPYDTIRLAAVAQREDGSVLSAAPAPHIVSTDVERLVVDSAGVLHARKTGTSIVVYAVDTVDDIVHADTAWVNVTSNAQPPVLASLSIHPIPPDSARFALGGTVFQSNAQLQARLTDTTGKAMYGVAVYYTSSDPSTATIDPLHGTITAYRVAAVTFTATATAYGVTKADTLPFTVELPAQVTVPLQISVNAQGDTILTFPISSTTISAGGDVAWDNTTELPVDVTFDDSTKVTDDALLCYFLTQIFGAADSVVACGQGNITTWGTDTSGDDYVKQLRMRQFPTAGTYHYHSTRYGTSGTVVVQ